MADDGGCSFSGSDSSFTPTDSTGEPICKPQAEAPASGGGHYHASTTTHHNHNGAPLHVYHRAGPVAFTTDPSHPMIIDTTYAARALLDDSQPQPARRSAPRPRRAEPHTYGPTSKDWREGGFRAGRNAGDSTFDGVYEQDAGEGQPQKSSALGRWTRAAVITAAGLGATASTGPDESDNPYIDKPAAGSIWSR